MKRKGQMDEFDRWSLTITITAFLVAAVMFLSK